MRFLVPRNDNPLLSKTGYRKDKLDVNLVILKSKIINQKILSLREGWQRKSSVERSGTEIAANDLTRIFRGSRPNKKTISGGKITKYLLNDG